MWKKILILLILAGIGYGGFRTYRTRTQAQEKPEIRTATVERTTVTNTVTATGTLQPLTTVDIKSKAGGRVDVLAVEVGTEVKPGQLIAKIDPTDTLTNVRTATADMTAARARVQQAQDNLSLEKLDSAARIRQAEEALRAASARLAQAEKQANIQPTLTKTSIAQAEAGLASAQATVRQLETATQSQQRAAAQAALDEAKAGLDSATESQTLLQKATIPQGRAQAKSAYDQARANVDVAKKELDRQKDLKGRGFLAQSAVDTAQNRYDLAVAQQANAKEKLDTLDAENASLLQSAKHRVTQAQAGVTSAKRKMDTLEAEQATELNGARARVAQAQAQLDSANANAVQDQLKQDDVASARAAVRQAQASLDSAKASLKQAQIRAADIQTARAQVTSSSARLQNANTQYEQTTIAAPRAGVVLQKYVEQGTIITSGTSAIAQGTNIVQLGDLSRMFVDVLVDEADIAAVEVGQQVDVNVDAYTAEVFEGKVTRIDPQAVTEQNVTTVKVTVEVENADARLKPGMNASCDFIVERAEDVLAVPSEAVKEDDNGKSTVTVLEGEKQVVRDVETGITGGDSTEIKSGLKEGETVITAIIEPVSSGGSSSSRGGSMGRPGGAMGGMPRSGGGR